MSERRVTVEQLAEEIVSRYKGRRLLVGLAGAPGSGKSTLAETLKALLNTQAPGLSAVFPMDGYHYDDALLRELGRLQRKGAPDTFDVSGLAHMLDRLRVNEEERVAVPVFDRSLEASRAAARFINRQCGVVLTEGNYLLLKRPPWDQLEGRFDLTVMLRASPEVLRRRLEQRWRFFNLSEAEVRRRVETNDLPNGMAVANESRMADYIVDQSG